MSITPIPAISAIAPATGAAGAASPVVGKSAPGVGGGFGQTLSGLVTQINRDHAAADAAIDQFASGKISSLNEVVLATAKADLSLQLLVEIRNKLIDAYQEIMRMQV